MVPIGFGSHLSGNSGSRPYHPGQVVFTGSTDQETGRDEGSAKEKWQWTSEDNHVGNRFALKRIKSNKELEKIGVLVYINSIVKNIDIPKKEFCFDIILEYLQFNMNECNHLAIKVITDKKIKEVPDYLKKLFESKDDDEKYDLFVRFLSDCGVS